MRYSTGLHRSPPEKTAHRLGAHLLGLAATPKGSADLKACPRMDQDGSGTCHAHSAAAACWTAFYAKGKPLPFVPSPLLIAATTYADVQRASVSPGQALAPLQDTGAQLQDDATALARWGIAPIQAPTADGRYSDVPSAAPDVSFPEPDTSQLQVAGADLVAGEYQIPVDADAPRTVALCLDAGIPVWIGFFCDSAFQELGPTDVAGAPNESDPEGGGHAVYLSAYRTNTAGAFEYRLENSWGSGWAANGAVWVSEAFILATWNLWPFAVVS